MKFIVRPIADADIEGALASYRAAVRAVREAEYTPSILEEWANRDANEFVRLGKSRMRFVAECDGAVVGYAGLDASAARLTECYVMPAYSGCSIGSTLVRTVEEEAVNAHLRHLDVLASLNSVGFYTRQGFVEVGSAYLKMGNEQNMRCMSLRKAMRAPSL